jgi:hypothetical protein
MSEPAAGPAPVPPVRPEAARPLAEPPRAGDAAAGPAYRPLALLAVVGLAGAVLFALFLVAFFAVSFFRGTPAVLNLAWLTAPAASLVLSLLGWLQVQRSEGTQAGGRLALVGMALSLFFGLGCAAVSLATGLALRQQAEPFAREWLETLKKGQSDPAAPYEAFRLTIDPASRPLDKGDVRRELEVRFNGPEGGPRGRLSGFLQADYVRMLERAGPAAEIQPGSILSWSWENNGYSVRIAYPIQTPEATTELEVTVQGVPVRSGGLEWFVDPMRSGMRPPTEESPTVVVTRRGDRVYRLMRESATFVEAWANTAAAGKAEDAFLGTQPPPTWRELRAAYQGQLALAQAAAALAPGGVLPEDDEAGRRAYLPGYRGYAEGVLVRAEPGIFWAKDDATKARVVGEARQLFARAGSPISQPFAPEGSPQSGPLYKVAGSRLLFYHTVRVALSPKDAAEGALVVETDAAELDGTGLAKWRVAALELFRGGEAPPTLPGGPPGR